MNLNISLKLTDQLGFLTPEKRTKKSTMYFIHQIFPYLLRRFEVLDNMILIEEKIEIVTHYTQQLVNSGYLPDQIRDIIESSLKGVLRKEKKRKEKK